MDLSKSSSHQTKEKQNAHSLQIQQNIKFDKKIGIVATPVCLVESVEPVNQEIELSLLS